MKTTKTMKAIRFALGLLLVASLIAMFVGGSWLLVSGVTWLWSLHPGAAIWVGGFFVAALTAYFERVSRTW